MSRGELEDAILYGESPVVARDGIERRILECLKAASKGRGIGPAFIERAAMISELAVEDRTARFDEAVLELDRRGWLELLEDQDEHFAALTGLPEEVKARARIGLALGSATDEPSHPR